MMFFCIWLFKSGLEQYSLYANDSTSKLVAVPEIVAADTTL